MNPAPDVLAELRRKNPGLTVADCASPSFAEFGRLLPGLDTGNLVEYLKTNAPVGEGTSYLRSVTGFEDLPGPEPAAEGTGPRPGPAPHATWKQYFSRTVFGGLPVQMGWVIGKSRKLNALEYHKSSEVLVAGSDLLLLLGRLGDIENYRRYDAGQIRAFLVREGQALETWSATLHFAPVMVSEAGFRAAIILPAETNAPLARIDPSLSGEEGLLWAANKWLIACPGSGQAGKGACAGITRNIEVNF